MTSNCSQKLRVQPKKISFWVLCKSFRFKLIKHFLFTATRVLLGIIIWESFSNLFLTENKSSISNFTELLLPEKIRQWGLFKNLNLNEKQFIVVGLFLVVVYAFFYYWDSLWEEELGVKGEHYSKNLLLDKFRQLTFIEKQNKKDVVNKLVESDAWEIGHYWEHLPNHVFHSVLTIIITLYFHWDNFWKMTSKEICFSLFWLALINIIVYFFTKKIVQNEKKYKKALSQEWVVINKERSNINLVEGMGLTSQYRLNQRRTSKRNEKLVSKFALIKSLNKTIPSNLLMESFPFILLFLSNDFKGKILIAFWQIFGNFGEIFRCFWEYADYSSSLSRVNSFLSLPEKNDNLTGKILNENEKIVSIHCQNVSFRYQENGEWIVKNYNRTFTNQQINYLVGENGTGKSTILYLLLGMLVPQTGQIMVENKQGQIYNLHHDLNLSYWRKHHIAYAAHETLCEQGSTGQKQWTNIQDLLTQRSQSHIFCWDEVDNALDVDKKGLFQKELRKLIENNKLVIYISH